MKDDDLRSMSRVFKYTLPIFLEYENKYVRKKSIIALISITNLEQWFTSHEKLGSDN